MSRQDPVDAAEGATLLANDSLASEQQDNMLVGGVNKSDDVQQLEDRDGDLTLKDPAARHGDTAAQLIGTQHIVVTEEHNKRILRKTDKRILAILVWVYFLQILDKSVLGYGAIFGLRTDTHLTGDQYSMVSSVSAIVTLAWQPFSSWLIVTVPHRILMPSLVLGWGIAQACMAASHSYAGLIITRSLLGLFEAGCLPLFSVITSQWYRRAEQPLRVALWYGTNGLSTMFAAALSYGLSHIQGNLHSWQILFIFVGSMTVVTAPVAYYVLDNDIASARFLTEDEKLMALERLRANQTGTGSREFKLEQVWEALLETKTWLFVGISLCINLIAVVTNTFGPIVVSGFGFDNYRTSLLNIPFGFVQCLVIFASSWAAHHFRIKSVFLAVIMLPVLAGSIMLFVLGRNVVAPLLAAYYMLAFVYGGNPLLASWMIANTGGQTKKSVIMSLYNAGSAAGQMIGPLLFNQVDAPYYHPGLTKVMAVSGTLVAIIVMTTANLYVLNKMQGNKRVLNGKPRKIADLSMLHNYGAEAEDSEQAEGVGLGDNAFLDLTDRKNDEFVYVY